MFGLILVDMLRLLLLSGAVSVSVSASAPSAAERSNVAEEEEEDDDDGAASLWTCETERLVRSKCSLIYGKAPAMPLPPAMRITFS